MDILAYILSIGGYAMKAELLTTRPFISGHSQAVRVPNEYRMEQEELIVNKIGDALIYIPRRSLMSAYWEGLKMLSGDFMQDGRPDETENKEITL